MPVNITRKARIKYCHCLASSLVTNADTVDELSYTDGTGQVRIRMKRWVNFYKKNPANHYTSVVVVLVEWGGGRIVSTTTLVIPAPPLGVPYAGEARLGGLQSAYLSGRIRWLDEIHKEKTKKGSERVVTLDGNPPS